MRIADGWHTKTCTLIFSEYVAAVAVAIATTAAAAAAAAAATIVDVEGLMLAKQQERHGVQCLLRGCAGCYADDTKGLPYCPHSAYERQTKEGDT